MTSTEATAAGSNSSGIWNLPNILTMLRIVLVPFFVWFLIADAPGLHSESGPWRWAAVAAFAVAIYTDKLDGDIARSRGLVTDFGKIADPIADKLLIGSALVMLSVLNELPWWITAVILVREWGITALRFFVIRYGVIPASRGGKLKTVVQTVAIFLYLLPLSSLAPWLVWVAFAVMLVAVLITVWTGVEYVLEALKVRAQGLRHRAEERQNQNPDTTGRKEHDQPSPDRRRGSRGSHGAGRHRRHRRIADSRHGHGHAGRHRQARRPCCRAASFPTRTPSSGTSLAFRRNCSTPSAPSTATWPPPWPTARGRTCGADLGVSTTGVAGPDEHDGKPVGTVFIGIATAQGATSYPYSFEGTRAEIRALACAAALERLQEALASLSYRE